jgi:hypothetical protein
METIKHLKNFLDDATRLLSFKLNEISLEEAIEFGNEYCKTNILLSRVIFQVNIAN